MRARPLNLALLDLILVRRDKIAHPDPDCAATLVIDQLGAMFYARSDPYQKVSAIARCDDEALKSEVLRWANIILGLQASKTNI